MDIDLGCFCFASRKYEEISAPHVEDFRNKNDNTYTRKEVYITQSLLVLYGGRLVAHSLISVLFIPLCIGG